MAGDLAGHPIAIRVGGRRLSQSAPIKSPPKGMQASPSSSLESNADHPIVPTDYPRPTGPPRRDSGGEGGQDGEQTHEPSHEHEHTEGEQEEERRRRRKGGMSKAEADRLSKESGMNRVPRKMSGGGKAVGGGAGRISQPAQKMM